MGRIASSPGNKRRVKTAPARKSGNGVTDRMPQRYNYRSAVMAFNALNSMLMNMDMILRKTGQSLSVYRNLLTDAHLTAALLSRESATLSYQWRIERGDCPVRLYQIIEKWFFSIMERKMSADDLSRDELTSSLMDVIYWGYQPAELTWDYVYGLWLPIQVTPKPPEWFQWFTTDDGRTELRFMSVNHPLDGEPPPDPWTIICPRIKPSYDNPYGLGVASRCFWPVTFKRADIEFWLNFQERFGMPWVKGSIQGNADDATMKGFASTLKELVQDAIVVVSGNRNVELLESRNSAGSSDGFRMLCEYMDSQMSKVILGHTLATDAFDKSSYAATRGALTVRTDIQKRDITMIRSIWNDIINLIFLRNGYLETPRPNSVPYQHDEVDLARATRDEALTRAGVRFSKSYFIRTYRLENDDIEEIVSPSQRQSTDPRTSESHNVDLSVVDNND